MELLIPRATRALVALASIALLACARPTDAPRPIPGRNLGVTPCAARVSKGPWSLAIGPTSATVRWESCLPAAATLSYAAPSDPAPRHARSDVARTIVTLEIDTERGVDAAGTFFAHEVRLTSLTPSTCYELRVDGEAKRGRLCTARAPGDVLTFAALGDTNPARGHTQAVFASLLARGAPDFTLHAGDLQYYESGLESYAFWFSAMSPLLLAGPLLPVLGNHEAEEPNELAEHFRRYFHDAGTDGFGDAWAFSSAGVAFFGLDTEADFGPGSAQAEWLVRSLAAAAARPGYRFAVVVMHRPFVTCGDSDDHPAELAALDAAFRAYRVRLVIQGHQHGYERFEIGATTFVTTGGGGAVLENEDTNLARPYCGARVAAGSFYHAMLFTVGWGTLDGVAIDEAGAPRDSFRERVP